MQKTGDAQIFEIATDDTVIASSGLQILVTKKDFGKVVLVDAKAFNMVRILLECSNVGLGQCSPL